MRVRMRFTCTAVTILSLSGVLAGTAPAGAEAGCNNGESANSFTLSSLNGDSVTNGNSAWRFRVKRTTNDPGFSPTTTLNAQRAGAATISNATSNLNTYTGRWSTNYPTLRTSEQVVLTGQSVGHAFDYSRSCTKV